MDQLGEAKTAEEAKNKAEAAESKLATALSQYVRLQADFDNFRRRTREAEAKAADTHTAETLKAFLPVLDNFELALAHMKKMKAERLMYRASSSCKTIRQNLGRLRREGDRSTGKDLRSAFP